MEKQKIRYLQDFICKVVSIKKNQIFATLLAPRWILLVEMHQGEVNYEGFQSTKLIYQSKLENK